MNTNQEVSTSGGNLGINEKKNEAEKRLSRTSRWMAMDEERGGGGGGRDINKMAEDFINKFRNQLKIQREDSLNRFREMIARGT
ncbi:hypothetical protein RHMOL_Rhmol13G0302400 [Rhododendron molle]|uniref:Uncharacterized protein n=1 Tax=Rhododendron molle TaxID=49168 RepID=A0ACC0LCS5_RHOML|nr:hypothetical protein RHMOL_Rhmol13G0302400 [Rhododendron molle]